MSDNKECQRDESVPLIDGHPSSEATIIGQDEPNLTKKIFKRKPTGKPMTVRADLKKARIRFSSTDTQLFSDTNGHKSVNQWQSYSHLDDNDHQESNQADDSCIGSKSRSAHSDSDLSSVCMTNEENDISEEHNNQNKQVCHYIAQCDYHCSVVRPEVPAPVQERSDSAYSDEINSETCLRLSTEVSELISSL